MAEEKRLICASASVTECGRGVRFTVEGAKGPVPAFVVRHAGKVRGYLNRCAHVGVELSFPLFFVFQPNGIMPPIAAHAES